MRSLNVTLSALLGLLGLMTMAACVQVERKNPGVDYRKISSDFTMRAPADIAILPVEADEAMNVDCRKTMRQSVYDQLMEKGYAPAALDYVDKLMRDEGCLDMHLSSRDSWNTDPITGLFFCDGVMMVSIESFRESGMPDSKGIEIWGKAALLDAKTMELLYENYIRRKLIMTDTKSREDNLAKAIRDYVRDVLAYLPEKPDRTGNEVPNP